MSNSKKLLPEDFWKRNTSISTRYDIVGNAGVDIGIEFGSHRYQIPEVSSSIKVIDFYNINRGRDYLSTGPIFLSEAFEPSSEKIFGLSDVSDIIVSDQGIIAERWDAIENIPSSIIELGNNAVTLECLVDIDTRKFQRRIFDSMLLEGIVKFEVGKLVLIKIFKRPGEIRFKFLDGSGLVNPEYFDAKKIKDYFKDIPKGKFDKHLKFNNGK